MGSEEEYRQTKREEFGNGGNISKLRRRMYSRARKGFLPWRHRRNTNTQAALAKSDWEYDKGEPTKKKDNPNYQGYTKRGVSGLLIFSLIFFIITLIGSVSYLFLISGSTTSREIDISIEGSSAVAAGEVLELQVLVTNRNDTALELADLIIEYADGTVSPVDFRTPLLGERIPLGLIEPRSARRGAVRAVIFGNNGDAQAVKVELQYRLRGSSAIHSKKVSHAIIISSDAMGVTIDSDTELTPGQSMPMSVTVKSYSSTVINGAYLDASLPFGFTIIDSSPAPVEIVGDDSKDVRWIIGSLRPGEEREVYISASVEGQVGDARSIQFTAGSGINKDGTSIGSDRSVTILASRDFVVNIKRPFLEVSLQAYGGNLSDYAASSGEELEVVVKWHNNLSVPINDASIKVILDGSALNKTRINSGQDGFYRSVDSLLLWDSKTTRAKLKVIKPGGKGEFKFRLTPLSAQYLEKLRKPYITFAVHVSGKRLSEDGVPESLNEDALYEVKVGTDARLSAYGLFRSSPFGALGPMPPKVEYETTYAVVWEVSNTTSDIDDAIVRAELPHYVRWVGLTSPANEQIIYNKVDHTLKWHLGKVKAGTGTLNREPRSVSFAVGLVPSSSQLGSIPELVRNQVFEAVDSYTKEPIVFDVEAVDIRITEDSGFQSEDSIITE